MARRSVLLALSIALLLLVPACGDCWWFCYDDDYYCWYDEYGNLWCDDGYYAYAVRTEGEGSPVASQEVLSLVNAERTAAGLEPLWLSEVVARVASEQASDLGSQGTVDGVAPAGAGVGDRLGDLGVEAPRWDVACFAGDVTPADVVAAWMADDRAREAILDPAMDSGGVGVHAIEGMTWWAIVVTGP